MNGMTLVGRGLKAYMRMKIKEFTISRVTPHITVDINIKKKVPFLPFSLCEKERRGKMKEGNKKAVVDKVVAHLIKMDHSFNSCFFPFPRSMKTLTGDWSSLPLRHGLLLRKKNLPVSKNQYV